MISRDAASVHQGKQRPVVDGSVPMRCESGIKFAASSQAQNEGFERVYGTEPKFLDLYTEHAGAEPKSQAPGSQRKGIRDRTQVLRLIYLTCRSRTPKSQAQAMLNKNIQDRTQVLRLVMQ